MNYANDHIRNVLVAGHGGAGKTSLVEAMLYLTKATDRQGRVEDGNTVCDFDPEEIKRHVSLSLAVAPVEQGNVKLNLIDVPGLFDFEAGLYEGMPAAESVMVVVSARSGLAVGARKAYQLALKQNKSRMIFVNKVNAEHADFYKVFEQLKAELGPSVCPVVVPVEQAGGRVYLNLITQKAYSYTGGGVREVPVPSYGHRTEGLLEAMREAAAETDDTLMEKFFEGEPFTEEELTEAIRTGAKTGAITPVFCGSATAMEAVDLAVWGLQKLMPSAARGAGAVGTDASGNEVEVPCVPDAPLCAYVFKTVADPFVGKVSYVKVISGKLTADTAVVNARTGEAERLGKLVYVRGKKQTDTAEIGCRRHRRRHQAAHRADGRHAVRARPRGEACRARCSRTPRFPWPCGCQAEGRRKQNFRRVAAPDGRGPHHRLRGKRRDGRAGALRPGRAAPGRRVRQVGEQVWRRGYPGKPAHSLPRVHPQESARRRAATKNRRAAMASSAMCGLSLSPQRKAILSLKKRCLAAPCPRTTSRRWKRACRRPCATACWPVTRWWA